MSVSKADDLKIRETLEQYDKQQIVEILVSTIKNEARLRNELDRFSSQQQQQ